MFVDNFINDRELTVPEYMRLASYDIEDVSHEELLVIYIDAVNALTKLGARNKKLELVARLYYIDDYSQLEIGNRFRKSQATVSRMLAEATEILEDYLGVEKS